MKHKTLERLAAHLTGGLSNTSKMPGFSYSLPTSACRTGGILSQDMDTPCHKCYARKGRYVFGACRKAMLRRLDAISAPCWVAAMEHLINLVSMDCPFFRWHDSGDIQSMKHLEDIVEICRRTPNTRHFLPTKEYETIHEYLKNDVAIPDNLTIRICWPYIGLADGTSRWSQWLDESVLEHQAVKQSVVMDMSKNFIQKAFIPVPKSDGSTKHAFVCQATVPKLHGGRSVCGNCRACWSRSCDFVAYLLH